MKPVEPPVAPRLSRREFMRTAAAASAAFPAVLRAAAATGLEIGIVADPQYADLPPRINRYYRASIARLGEAVDHFEGRDLAFCVNLGDLIDRDWNSFDAISAPLRRSRHRWFHLLGNHDFEVADQFKARVPQRLGLEQRYHAFERGGFVFAVLDTNDVSLYAHVPGSAERQAAEAEFAKAQAARIPQAKPWNASVGAPQLAWLERTCREAARSGRRVIILAHHPLAPDGPHNLWNAPEVLSLLERHRSIVAWLNGHNHAGGFAERFGVPLVTFHGMVETEKTSAFATARLLSDRMIITGHGREPSRELPFRPVG